MFAGREWAGGVDDLELLLFCSSVVETVWVQAVFADFDRRYTMADPLGVWSSYLPVFGTMFGSGCSVVQKVSLTRIVCLKLLLYSCPECNLPRVF